MSSYLEYCIKGGKTYRISPGKFRSHDLVYVNKQGIRDEIFEIKRHIFSKKTKLYSVKSIFNRPKETLYFRATDLKFKKPYFWQLQKTGIKGFRVLDMFEYDNKYYYIDNVNGNYIYFKNIRNIKDAHYISKYKFNLNLYKPLGLVYDPSYTYYAPIYACHYQYVRNDSPIVDDVAKNKITSKTTKPKEMILVEYNSETLAVVDSLEELKENTELKIIDKDINKDKLNILKKLVELNWIDHIDNLKR